MTLVGYGPREDGGRRRRRRRPDVTVAGAQTSFNLPPATAPHPAPEPAAVDSAPEPVAPRRRERQQRPAPGACPATGRWPSRRCASWPRRSASTSRRSPLPARTARSPATTCRPPCQAPTAAPNRPRCRRSRPSPVPARPASRSRASASTPPPRWCASAFTAPHVTEFVTVDVTATMELRDRVAARREFRDVKVSPLLFVAKAVLLAAARTPEINATWDDAAGEIVLKHYVNLGIAAATQRGLIVPNIRDAHQLSLLELARAITELTETARAGRTTPEAMAGGTFTITNVGVFGVDTGTPILNPGESGILAFGAVRRMPWVVGTGRGRADRAALGHPAGRVLRPPHRRRPAGFALPRRRRGHALGSGPGPARELA